MGRGSWRGFVFERILGFRHGWVYFPTWLGRVEHLIEVGREVHGKSRRAVTLSSGKMSATMVSVTLGAIPWALCARYVRCTRTDFPPQTRPPFQSSRRCVAGTVKFVKSRNSSGERTRYLESARNWLQISLHGPTRAVALAAGTEDGVWSRWSCVELGAGLSRGVLPFAAALRSSPFLFATI